MPIPNIRPAFKQALAIAALSLPLMMGMLAQPSHAEGVPTARPAMQKMQERRNAATPEQREQFKQRHEKMMQERLGLSDAQAEQMKGIRERSMQQGKALSEKARAKRTEMMQYLKTPGATESGALRLHNELNDLQGQLGALRIKTWFDMREHLSAEQLQKMEQMHGPQGGPGGSQSQRGPRSDAGTHTPDGPMHFAFAGHLGPDGPPPDDTGL